MEAIISTNTPEPVYQDLLVKISDTFQSGQVKATQAVNTQLPETHRQIGQHIVEFEQGGNARAEYGKALINNLAKNLSLLHGKGFSASNVKRFRQFYLAYPIGATLSHQLTWSHVVELLKVDDALERSFYEKQTQLENWNVNNTLQSEEDAKK